MPIFLERYLLPVLATMTIGVILLNPFKFDRTQQITLAICIVALAYFVGHTLERNKSAAPQAAVPVAQTAPRSGDAITNGDNSPAVSGNGNTFEHDSTPKTEQPAPQKG
jgi:hypothetical protein